MNYLDHTEQNARLFCFLRGLYYRGHDSFQVYYYGIMPDKTISYGSIIWYGVENTLNDFLNGELA